MRGCRMPLVGDMLVVTPCPDRYSNVEPNKEYVGVIYEIHRDKYGHQHKVMVEWADKVPANYNISYGYSGVNIHNLRQEFRVFRGGKEVIG